MTQPGGHAVPAFSNGPQSVRFGAQTNRSAYPEGLSLSGTTSATPDLVALFQSAAVSLKSSIRRTLEAARATGGTSAIGITVTLTVWLW